MALKQSDLNIGDTLFRMSRGRFEAHADCAVRGHFR